MIKSIRIKKWKRFIERKPEKLDPSRMAVLHIARKWIDTKPIKLLVPKRGKGVAAALQKKKKISV